MPPSPKAGRTKATRDLITDFEDGLDEIWLNPIDANTKNGTTNDPLDAFTFIGNNVVFTGTPGQLRTYWTANGHIVEGDVNGDKKADFSIEILDPTHASSIQAILSCKERCESKWRANAPRDSRRRRMAALHTAIPSHARWDARARKLEAPASPLRVAGGRA
jgi:hypothetical protein